MVFLGHLGVCLGQLSIVYRPQKAIKKLNNFKKYPLGARHDRLKREMVSDKNHGIAADVDRNWVEPFRRPKNINKSQFSNLPITNHNYHNCHNYHNIL